MEAVEEMPLPLPPMPLQSPAMLPPVDSTNKDHVSPIAKGKRTKRQRPLSPVPFTIAAPLINAVPSPSTAVSSEDSTTTEEEDTARCLLLLARGHFPASKMARHDYHRRDVHDEYFNNSVKNNVGTLSKAAAGGGACVYACKTCGRCFSSFQALGGHRSSHQKFKQDKKSPSTELLLMSDEDDFPSTSISSATKNHHQISLSLQLNTIPSAALKSPSPRTHECSYCGAEFSSGQALGGHMRRHRSGPISHLSKPPLAIAALDLELSRKPANALSLDLNLPAPEDDHLRFGFDSSKQQASREKGNETAIENQHSSQ